MHGDAAQAAVPVGNRPLPSGPGDDRLDNTRHVADVFKTGKEIQYLAILSSRLRGHASGGIQGTEGFIRGSSYTRTLNPSTHLGCLLPRCCYFRCSIGGIAGVIAGCLPGNSSIAVLHSPVGQQGIVFGNTLHTRGMEITEGPDPYPAGTFSGRREAASICADRPVDVARTARAVSRYFFIIQSFLLVGCLEETAGGNSGPESAGCVYQRVHDGATNLLIGFRAGKGRYTTTSPSPKRIWPGNPLNRQSGGWGYRRARYTSSSKSRSVRMAPSS